MNDLPVAGYPCYAQRTLGSTEGKHCKSLEGNLWRKVVSTSKGTILRRDQRFIAFVLLRMDLGNIDARNHREICDEKLTIPSLTCVRFIAKFTLNRKFKI